MFLGLHIIRRCNNLAYLVIIFLVANLIVWVWLGTYLALILICDLQTSHLLLLHQVYCLQLVILLLILGDSHEKRRISLLLGHELLDDLSDV